MHTKFNARSRKVFLAFLLGGIIVILGSLGIGSPVAHAQKQGTPPPRTLNAASATPETERSTRYYSVSTMPLSNGLRIEKHIIGGPPMPPSGFEEERQPVGLVESENSVPGEAVASNPAYVLGCSSSAAGDIATMQDNQQYPILIGDLTNGALYHSNAVESLMSGAQYPNLYTGPTNGGIMPSDYSAWPTWEDDCGNTFSNNPLIASHAGVDGRPITTRGTIDDYWTCYESTEPDPYITNGWTEHAPETLGDYMLTSQSAHGNSDGSTTFITYENSARLYTCDAAASRNAPDGSLGRRLFYESRGYAVAECYNQPTSNVIAGGFSLAQYKAEIDAGRPVMIGLEGHNVVGIGYNPSSTEIYIHDGWDYATHSMTWGGSYTGFPMLMVSIVNPIPPAHAGDYTISGYTGVPNTTITYTGGSTKTGSSGYYSFSVAPGWSGTVTPSKPGYTFEPGYQEYDNLPDYQTAQDYTAILIPGSNLVQDPGFEAGVSNNPYWAETSTNFGTPLCDASCGEGARTGSAWAWMGGMTGYTNETATLSQIITIPEGSSASLDFYLWIYEAAAGSGTDDVFTVKVDGATLFSTNATQINSYSFYIPISVDVSAYADGSSHTVEFKSVTSGQVVAFFLDDVSLAVVPTVTYTISGNVGVANATITYTGGSTTADGNGDYSFSVPSGWSGTVTPSRPGFSFAPASREYDNITENLTDQNYTMTLLTLVSAITRLDNSPTDLPSVRFTVTFTGSVTGVSASEFALTTTGVSGAGITGITGSGASRTVTVNTGSGTGTIRLDLVDHDNIIDGSGNPLGGTGQGNGSFNTGETYTLTSYVTKPASLSPKNAYLTNSSQPSLDWSAVPGAHHYEIQLASDSLFNQNVQSYSDSAPPFTFGTALTDRRYYWRVQAYDSRNSPGGWSILRYFTVDTTLPVAPALRSPADNATVRSVPIFRWSAVSGAVQYEFEIDNDENFSSPVFSVMQRVPYRRPAGVLRGTYFWHVRARDAAGNWSAWSETFTINILPRIRPSR